MFGEFKRFLVGPPVSRALLSETLLPKRVALPVFCSDPISSVAYATEQIVLVLAVGGAAALALSTPVAGAVAVLLVVVVASYRQTVHAYPNGGGAFVVSRENLGERAALVAGSALLVDYVMTVAVSVTSGVVAVTSAFRSLAPFAAEIAAAVIMLLAVVNLRGIRESGRAFAVPTYLFIGLTYLLLGVAAVRSAQGTLPPAESATMPLEQASAVGGLALAVLLLRAFASGCTALTGVEAISNGVPAFRPPKARNAAATLVIMGAIAVTLFAGITVLAVATGARAEPDGNPSVISQLAASSFGGGSALYYAFQAATAAILVLAANTAFNGFPMLASLLARDGYLPRQLANRGDRLVFSNGILLLGAVAAGLILAVDANLEALLHLYILGVFTSFTLSQAGMVRHWQRQLHGATDEAPRRGSIRRAQAINLTGAVLTGVVLVVVFATKVLEGAWIAVVAMVGDLSGHAGGPPPLRPVRRRDRPASGRIGPRGRAVTRARRRAGRAVEPAGTAGGRAGAVAAPGDHRGGGGGERPGRGAEAAGRVAGTVDVGASADPGRALPRHRRAAGRARRRSAQLGAGHRGPRLRAGGRRRPLVADPAAQPAGAAALGAAAPTAGGRRDRRAVPVGQPRARLAGRRRGGARRLPPVPR